MSVRSFGNALASFRYRFGNTGNRASNPYVERFSASGGNVANGAAPGNGYKYHVFTTPGSFTVSGPPNTGEWLMIGGGGTGGNGDAWNGGGGAGGVVYRSTQSFTPGSYAVYIGAARSAPISPTNPGSPFFPTHNQVNVGYLGGEDSEFTIDGYTIYALGGGSGSSRAGPQPSDFYTTGYTGGSGGGGGTGYPGGPNPPGPGESTSQPSQNPGVPNLFQYGNAGTPGGPTPTTYAGPGGSANPSQGTSFAMSLTPNPTSVLISGSPVAPYQFAVGGSGYNYPNSAAGNPGNAPATSYGSGSGGGVNQNPAYLGSPGVLIIMYPE